MKKSSVDTLIAILKHPRDFTILKELGWYRIPVKNNSKEPIKSLYNFTYLAFYQPSSFGENKWKIEYYGQIKGIEIVKRKELIPKEIGFPNEEHLYYKIIIPYLIKLEHPIVSRKGRRITFLSTSYQQLLLSNEINDLFNGSYLEEILWKALRENKIHVERQYPYKIQSKIKPKNFCLDFAIECQKGKINIECDGDRYHINRSQAQFDNDRNNLLAQDGWSVLRFNTNQITRDLPNTITTIKNTIKNFGGLK